MKFTKMHGAGNDFIIISLFEEAPPPPYSALAISLCDRRNGIGADGLMLVARPNTDADIRLIFYNADGSIGEMCGNGARCIARYAFEHDLAGRFQRIETKAGLVIGERISKTLYRVRLNDPSIIDERCAEGCSCCYVELGNPGIPHAVVLLDDWDVRDKAELRELGRRLRYSPVFPKGANISFAKIIGHDRIKAITYERGVEDFTLACGTGSAAVAIAAILSGRVCADTLCISMPGGELCIDLKRDEAVHDIYLTGPTCVVCEGDTKEI